MGSLRTLEHIAEDYADTRAALKRAKEALEYGDTDGTTAKSVKRERVDVLTADLRALDAEYTKASSGGIRMRGVIPLG